MNSGNVLFFHGRRREVIEADIGAADRTSVLRERHSHCVTFETTCLDAHRGVPFLPHLSRSHTPYARLGLKLRHRSPVRFIEENFTPKRRRAALKHPRVEVTHLLWLSQNEIRTHKAVRSCLCTYACVCVRVCVCVCARACVCVSDVRDSPA